MKLSKYCYIVPLEENKFLLYHAVSNSLMEIDEDIAIAVKSEDIDYIKNIGDMYKIFTQYEILIEDFEDELNKIKYQLLSTRLNKEYLGLVILPTLSCNFACPYCYENQRPDVFMSSDVANKIITYINAYKDIKNLSILWYGGEPLLNFQAIEKITKGISIKAKYQASIISNGYLLNKDIAQKLSSLSIKSIQITIDGDQLTHDSRRYLIKNNGATYQTIIDNIKYLLAIDQEIIVKIRMNIDKENEEDISQASQRLYEEFKNNKQIVIRPGFVSDYDSILPANNLMSKKEEAMFYLQKNNQLIVQDFYPIINSECMGTHCNSFVIDSEGFFFKCMRDIGHPERRLGSINSISDFNSKLFLKYVIGSSAFNDEVCKSCFYLPICRGGDCACNKIWNNKRICLREKGFLDKFLIQHYNKIRATQLKNKKQNHIN